jgi:hypothetical protein
MLDTLLSLGIITFCAPTLVFWSVVTSRLIVEKRLETPPEKLCD